MSRQEEVLGARTVDVEGQPVRFATAEDLILLKIVSQRPRDRADVQGVARRQGRRLDLDYLEPRIEELARLLDRPEIADFWRSLDPRSA